MDPDRDRRVDRRTYLGIVGAASAATAMVGVASGVDESDYERVVDIVEAGADNTGEEPIDDVFEEEARDDTLLEFPEGTYRVNHLSVYQLTQFAMVGTGEATLVPGEDYDPEVWIGGTETENFRMENFTIDNTATGHAPEVDISAYDGLVIKDVRKVGYHDNGGAALGFYTLRSDGNGLVENVTATDGGTGVGLYIESEGPMTVRNCRIEGFADNGLYASASSAPVRVEGGRYRNNNVDQVRLGSAGSYVRDSEIVVDAPVEVPEGRSRNMRGIRVSDGPGPVTIENCDVWMSETRGTGAIVGAFDGGSFEVRDTRIAVDESYTTMGSGGTDTSYAVMVQAANGVEPGTRSFRNVSVTGSGTDHGAMLFRRGANDIQDVCIDQDGTRRDGLIFVDCHDNDLRDAIVNVPGDPVVTRDASATTDNVSTSGSCPPPGETSGATGEAGRVVRDQDGPDDWASVGLSGAYDAPVAVAGPLSYAGPNPCHVRIRDVTDRAFDVQFEEWRYSPDGHLEERADYHVAERGVHDYGGLTVEAGDLWTNHQFASVTFEADFGERPVVLGTPQTEMGSDPVVTRVGDVSRDGAGIRVQEVEGSAHGGYHTDERVGYVALEPGTGSLHDAPVEVGVADVDEKWQTISFERSYERPLFLADVQTYNGPNTANLRYRNLGSGGVELFVEEDQNHDEETLHRYERVGYLVVEGA